MTSNFNVAISVSVYILEDAADSRSWFGGQLESMTEDKSVELMGATLIHVMLHISILPNRYDCLKHVRLAALRPELLKP